MTNDAEERCPSFLTNSDLKLIMFGGKGGVGKTTSAVASAIHIARTSPAKKILLASIDPAHSIQDSLADFEGHNNLKTMEIDVAASLKRFKEKHQETLRTIASRGSFLDDEDISRFLSLSMPGLDEVIGIIEVIEYLKSSMYDIVVLDTAPTGHTLRFLDLPDTIRRWLEALNSMQAKHRYMKMLYARRYKKDEVDEFLEGMSRDVKRLNKLLRDEKGCEFVPVMIAEKLAVQETARLLTFLKRHKIPLKNIIINRVYEYHACPLCRSQSFLHVRCLEEIKSIFDRYNLIKIPLYREEICGISALNKYMNGLVSIWRMGGDADCPVVSSGQLEGVVPALGAISLSSSGGCDSRNNGSNSLNGLVSGYPTTASCHISMEKARVIIVGGKGGVGKTTLSCAIALQVRDRYPARKNLLVSTDPAHSLSDCLDMPVGEKETGLYENLHALEIDAEGEFEGLKGLYDEEIGNMFEALLGGTMIDLGFDADVMKRLLDLSPPGLDEIMALIKIIDYLEGNRYDALILDTAPTGHLIRFLELPELIEDWLKAFFNIFLKYKAILRIPKVKNFFVQVSKRTKKLRDILVDQEKTLFFPVAIPTRMALEETKDLTHVLERLKIHYPLIFLNMIIPQNECAVCSDIRHGQEGVIRDYYKIFTEEKVRLIFHRNTEPRGLAELNTLGREMVM